MTHNICQQCLHAAHCLPLDKQLQALQFSARILKRGEYLHYQGQQSPHLYIIRAGSLKSYTIQSSGEDFVMGFYFPPDLFGWENMNAHQRSISIVALEQSNICIIPTEKMFALTQQIPTLGNQLLQMVSRRIQQDNIALLRTSAQQRVATFLLQLNMRYYGSQYSFPLMMTHQDIANYLRMTSSTISRIFNDWEKKKIIQIEKHKVTLLNYAEIEIIAESKS